MKYLRPVTAIIGISLVFVMSVAEAQQPDWWDDECLGILSRGSWGTRGSTCESEEPNDVKSGRNLGDIDIVQIENGIKATVENYYIKTRVKESRVILRGSGAPVTGSATINVAGTNDPGHNGGQNSRVTAIDPPQLNVDAAGNWSLEVHVRIIPQPDEVVVTVVFHAKSKTISVTEAWAWDCCTIIPAITPCGNICLTEYDPGAHDHECATSGHNCYYFDVMSPANVHEKVYDLRGRLVRRLGVRHLMPGTYQSVWDGRDHAGCRIAAGVYFMVASAGDEAAVNKVVILK